MPQAYSVRPGVALRNDALHMNLGYDALGRRNYELSFATDGAYQQMRYACSAASRASLRPILLR
ncbi:MAG: hypothetical protein Tsb0026_01270 [Sulfuricaulis sp.]